MSFSKETKDKYIREGVGSCPYCGSDDIVSTGNNEEYETDYQAEMECLGCGKHWLDLYKLVSIAEMEDDPVIP